MDEELTSEDRISRLERRVRLLEEIAKRLYSGLVEVRRTAAAIGTGAPETTGKQGPLEDGRK